jgi:hypothetical protein
MTRYGDAPQPTPHGDFDDIDARIPDGWLARAFVLVAAIAAVNIFLLLFSGRSSPDSFEQDALASALLWVGAIPLGHYFVRRPKSVPFFPTVCVIYVIYLALPRFRSRPLFSVLNVKPAPHNVTVGLLVALIGVTMLMVGYYTALHLVRRVPQMTRTLDLPRAVPWLALCSSLILANPTTIGGPELGQIPQMLLQIGELSISALFLTYLRGQLPPWITAYLFALLVARVLIGLGIGALADAGLPLIPPAFIYAWERRRVPWAFLIVSILSLVVLDASKDAFRAKYWSHAEVGNGRLSNGIQYLNITRETFTRSETNDLWHHAADRTNMLATLTIVTSDTPSRIPYWDGYTLQSLPWHFIPRILVPDKPIGLLGQDFPRRYGLLDYYDSGTSYNLAHIVELYINFGLSGVIGGMALIGGLYGLLAHVLGRNTGGTVIASCLFALMLNVESNITDTLGGVPMILLASYAYIRILPQAC